MRTLIIGVAAAVLAMAAPTFASADTRANLGILYSNVDPGGSSNNIDVWGLDGAFNHDFSNGWTVQGDGQSLRADVGSINLGASYAAVNLGMRTDSYAIYGWVGLADASILPSTSHIGIGGQLFFSNISLQASAAYADIDGVNSNPTHEEIDGAWYFNDDFDVNARVAHTDLDAGSNSDYTTWGVGAEYRFSGSPLSLRVGYDHSDTNPNDTNTWTIGLRMALGSDSLHDENMHGPSWNGARTFFDDIAGGIS